MEMSDLEAYDYYAKSENQMPVGPAHRRTIPVKPAHPHIRFNPEVIEQIKSLAAADNITVSSWVRKVIDAEIKRRTLLERMSQYADQIAHQFIATEETNDED